MNAQWERQSVEGFAHLAHAIQDFEAPLHGGRPYVGFTTMSEAGWTNFQKMLLEATTNYTTSLLFAAPFASTDWNRPTGAQTRRLPEAEGKKYYEYAWRNGCAFVIAVDASTDVILSWRYSANPDACRSVRSYTFGT